MTIRFLRGQTRNKRALSRSLTRDTPYVDVVRPESLDLRQGVRPEEFPIFGRARRKEFWIFHAGLHRQGRRTERR